MYVHSFYFKQYTTWSSITQKLETRNSEKKLLK